MSFDQLSSRPGAQILAGSFNVSLRRSPQTYSSDPLGPLPNPERLACTRLWWLADRETRSIPTNMAGSRSSFTGIVKGNAIRTVHAGFASRRRGQAGAGDRHSFHVSVRK